MNEAETRAEHIDPALRAAGWGVVEGSKVAREHPVSPGRIEGGSQGRKKEIADYVLYYKGVPLAVVEAKAWDKPHTEGVTQAKVYSTKLQARFGYATNGQLLYRIDMKSGEEGDCSGYPTPDELWDLVYSEANAWREEFGAVPHPDRSGTWGLRYYQDNAIRRALEAVANGKKRILLTLATGTGKTSIAFQIAWKLFATRWNLSGDAERRPRVLFLADRNGLANQAFNDFSSFGVLEESAMVRISPADIKKKGRVPKNANVFFTIFQTFMSGPNEAPHFEGYPPDFFDFIIVDECHRGGANDESSWREILEYFEPAVQLGMTATPKRRDNVDTYKYFGEPVYTYSLKEGINDGFLTPFKVRQISTTLDEYMYAPDDDVVEGDVDPHRVYTESDFNYTIEIREREAKRVELLMSLIDQREKSMVFCANQAHALVVRDLINQYKTSTNPHYCVRVTADEGERGDEALREFQDNEKSIPTILTTSHKLSTGVDARNVRNIVLMRPIRSMIEFKQIIGRGTRLFDGKEFFTIYDYVKAHHLFADPEWDGEPLVVDGEAPSPQPPQPPDGPIIEDPPPPPRPQRVKIKLAEGKALTIQHMMATSFWHPDGTPMSAEQFLKQLFGTLPDLFKNEEQLRTIWSSPDTRAQLLEGLGERGFGRAQLEEMQKIVEAEQSDVFDVLARVMYQRPPLTRVERASQAMSVIGSEFSSKQQMFLSFVLDHYTRVGVYELGQEKLTPLLKLKYNDSIPDAVDDLGSTDEIRQLFVGFQKYLYQETRHAQTP